MTQQTTGAELADMNDIAEQFFQVHLPDGWAPAYLASRGFGLLVQRRWHAGYAPSARDELTRCLRGWGFPDAVIEASGLARRSRRGTLFDTFRDRVMLPVRDEDGNVAAFTGRARADAHKGVPKYLNSPATCLYDKSETLFGLWEARHLLAGEACPVLVEGPFDAIAVTMAGGGCHAGVAACGTAFTARHVAALSRTAALPTTGVMVAFDTDAAGLRAAVRAYHLLASLGITATALRLPPGTDPAGVLGHDGPMALADLLVGRTHPLADLVVDAGLAPWSRWLAYPEGRVNTLHAVAPIVAAMPAREIARQVGRLAGRLRMSHSAVTGAVTTAVPGVVDASKDRSDS
jgi:DNA primase catalytic core